MPCRKDTINEIPHSAMSSSPPLRERWRNHQSPHVDGHVSEDHRQQITLPHKECCLCQPSNEERNRWPWAYTGKCSAANTTLDRLMASNGLLPSCISCVIAKL